MVAAWVDASHAKVREVAKEQQMHVVPHKLTPETKSGFWVNLIGRGYPTPRKLFRWCRESRRAGTLARNRGRASIRLRCCGVVRENGEAILLLGTRKAESQRRARTMAKHEKRRVRERLTPNASLHNSLVYTPIEDWSNDDVWLFLM